jgi:hypothetical protein
MFLADFFGGFDHDGIGVAGMGVWLRGVRAIFVLFELKSWRCSCCYRVVGCRKV